MIKETILKIVNSLNKLSVPYMLIGGQAFLVHGQPRLTQDIDITIGLGIEKSDFILDNLAQSGFKALPKNPSDFINKTFVLPLEDKNTKIRIDLIFSQTSYEKYALKKAVQISIEDTKINFASVEDLLIHKIFAARPRDLEDVRVLILKNPGINKKYIRKWLKEFDNILEGKNFLDNFNSMLKSAGR
jgi:predicted nucleotidyltransferase